MSGGRDRAQRFKKRSETMETASDIKKVLQFTADINEKNEEAVVGVSDVKDLSDVYGNADTPEVAEHDPVSPEPVATSKTIRGGRNEKDEEVVAEVADFKAPFDVNDHVDTPEVAEENQRSQEPVATDRRKTMSGGRNRAQRFRKRSETVETAAMSDLKKVLQFTEDIIEEDEEAVAEAQSADDLFNVSGNDVQAVQYINEPDVADAVDDNDALEKSAGDNFDFAEASESILQSLKSSHKTNELDNASPSQDNASSETVQNGGIEPVHALGYMPSTPKPYSQSREDIPEVEDSGQNTAKTIANDRLKRLEALYGDWEDLTKTPDPAPTVLGGGVKGQGPLTKPTPLAKTVKDAKSNLLLEGGKSMESPPSRTIPCRADVIKATAKKVPKKTGWDKSLLATKSPAKSKKEIKGSMSRRLNYEDSPPKLLSQEKVSFDGISFEYF